MKHSLSIGLLVEGTCYYFDNFKKYNETKFKGTIRGFNITAGSIGVYLDIVHAEDAQANIYNCLALSNGIRPIIFEGFADEQY